MMRGRPSLSCAAAILLGMALGGCGTGGDTASEEQKEPRFLSGQNLVRERDYKGAIEAYEEALQVNPRSASAHFELAWLNSEKAADPAAAIYHYQRFLKLCPASDPRADRARERINWCAQELARNVSASITLPPAAQNYLEKLAQENRKLKAQVAQWEAYYSVKTELARSNSSPPAPQAEAESSGQPSSGSVARPRTDDRTPSTSSKSHTVKSGDTLARIARNYGVSLGKLQAANPQVEASRLRIGSTLRIPSS